MDNITKMLVHRPAVAVFEALVDPAQMAQYWFSGTERLTAGGVVTWRYEEYGAEVGIRVLELEADRRLVFQWGVDGSGHVVTVTLTALDEERTVIEVCEAGFDEQAEGFALELADNKEGWVYMLTCLKAYVEFGIGTLRASLVK
ncbi:SRPBCC domain-containing protein [Paenibacillus athensensis]|uniref:Activator of Hsp90 ATPase homologue 1/2-like C-terminal domain-containing protein n=1 Tax=Paenibacillus athensensis TaxID=1967502 RepID=A0A4Y8Q8Y7_9BACL|nr:SRPBCC domain-containing protein [Paenibacillus athensensis]MCD1260151.1 SRPBCC domain-containing protein [Paenibacillus athensensis]